MGIGRDAGLDTERSAEKKSTADAESAFQPDAAAHQFDKLFGNCKAESGAAVFAGSRSIGLGEAFEDRIDFIGGDADAGIDHGEAQAAAIRRKGRIGLGFDSDFQTAGVGEFDGIAQQIDEHLAQTIGIADECDRRSGSD